MERRGMRGGNAFAWQSAQRFESARRSVSGLLSCRGVNLSSPLVFVFCIARPSVRGEVRGWKHLQHSGTGPLPLHAAPAERRFMV